MAIRYFNNSKSVALQLYNLKFKYKCINYSLSRGKLIWVQKVKPSEYSKEYVITLKYDGLVPEVYLYNQGIMKIKDEDIPHTYHRFYESEHNEYVKLCLYYPIYGEWTKNMFLSETIIPWAIDWLKYYELWRITGEWLGGGIEHGKD